MKFVTIDVLGTLDVNSGREILTGSANKSKQTFIAIDHIILMNMKEDKVHITISTGDVLITSLDVLIALKPLLS